MRAEKEAIVRKLNRSNSKGASEKADNAATQKPQRYNASDDAVIPAWYKALKKNLWKYYITKFDYKINQNNNFVSSIIHSFDSSS